MTLKKSLDGVAGSLGRFRSAGNQAATQIGRLQQNSRSADGSVGRLKNTVRQADTALGRAKSAMDKANTSLRKLAPTAVKSGGDLGKVRTGATRADDALGKMRRAATQGDGALGKLKSAATGADGGLGKARRGSDRLKTSLDKLRGAARTSRDALRDVKRQADAVESSVGKAGRKADDTRGKMRGLDKGVSGATKAQKGLNLAMRNNPMGMVVALLTPLVAQFVDMDKVVGAAKRGLERAWKAIRNATSDAIEFITPLLDGAKALFMAPIQGLVMALNVVFRALNRIQVKVPGWVPKFGGRRFGFDIPLMTVPALAAGGIVPARSGGRLALIGEGGEDEAVIPLSRLERMLGHHPGGAAAIHRLAEAVERLAERPVHVQVDSQTIARAVVRGHRQLARR